MNKAKKNRKKANLNKLKTRLPASLLVPVSNLTEIVELRVYFDWHMTNKRDVKWSNVL